nr:IS1380 family transposase [Thiolapillus sp.]
MPHNTRYPASAGQDADAVFLWLGGSAYRPAGPPGRLLHRSPQPREHRHSVRDLVAQRVYGLALGYEDLNDHDDLRKDSTLALLVGKRDLTGERRVREQDRGNPLAASSTLNRLELGIPKSAISDRYKRIAADNEAMDRLLVDLFLESYRKPPRKIWLDLDATDDPLHGQQEGRFFHGYYRCYCYLPLYIFSGEHLLCARLRTADKDASSGSVDELQRIVGQIRARWPKTRIIIRADSGFCRDAIMAWCETNDVGYVLGLARNKRLQRALGKEMEAARLACERTGETARCFRDFRYRTRKSWSCERRVIGKAEYLPGKANPRFVVTNLSTRDADAQHLYEDLYYARGEMENRIKEQQLGLFADRTSSATLRANQLRLYFSSFAYVLLHGLRRLGADWYGVRQGPEHDDPPEAAENRCPPAPDSAQGLAVLLGSVFLRQ